MSSGRKAFAGKTRASLLSAMLKDEAPALRQVQPLVPPALDDLVRTCLANDPGEGDQSADKRLLRLKWLAEGGSAGTPP